MRAFAVSTSLSRPSASFCKRAACEVRMMQCVALRNARGTNLHDRVHRDVVRHRRPDVALRAQAARRKRARQWAARRRGIIAPRIRQKRTPSGCRSGSRSCCTLRNGTETRENVERMAHVQTDRRRTQIGVEDVEVAGLLHAVCERQGGTVRRKGRAGGGGSASRNASAQRIDWSWSRKWSRPACVE